MDRSRYVFRKSIEASILGNLTILILYALFYAYINENADDAHFFLYLFIFPCVYLINDLRKKLIIERGSIRYVRLFGSKKISLQDVALIQSESEMSGGRMEHYIYLKDKEGHKHFGFPPEVLPKKQFSKFEKAVRAHSPGTVVDLATLEFSIFK